MLFVALGRVSRVPALEVLREVGAQSLPQPTRGATATEGVVHGPV
jgi:hypothetical protein